MTEGETLALAGPLTGGHYLGSDFSCQTVG